VAGLQRAFELLDEVPEVIERRQTRPLRRAGGAIEFRKVSFSYDTNHPVLKNISFSVRPGIRLGIQGSTGAGKSTLMSLLCRLYDPQAGEILLDGTDIRDYRLSDLRNQFAIMLQEPMLFSTSIAENIAYARPGADFKEIVAAARAANAHDFITRLSAGYQTLVGERGMCLSGGERQRISLARAYLKDAPILILDEPTCAVDLWTEAGILQAMERLMQGRTTLMIAHRASTLKICDELLRIENGQLISMTVNEPAAWHKMRVNVHA
jgi:ATP-binding cassette subfamily B protein